MAVGLVTKRICLLYPLVQVRGVLRGFAPNVANIEGIHDKVSDKNHQWNDGVSGWIFDRESEHDDNDDCEKLQGLKRLFECRFVFHSASFPGWAKPVSDSLVQSNLRIFVGTQPDGGTC